MDHWRTQSAASARSRSQTFRLLTHGRMTAACPQGHDPDRATMRRICPYGTTLNHSSRTAVYKGPGHRPVTYRYRIRSTVKAVPSGHFQGSGALCRLSA